MNKKQKLCAVATGVVIAQLAVLDYAAVKVLRDGFSVEISVDELKAAEAVAEADMESEGIEVIAEEGEREVEP